MDMQLTISIVSWNVRAYLENCLRSIFKYSEGIHFETIVVDNASCDGSLDMVKERFPQVITIQNNENLGYGPAHNQAIKIARGKYILFLNPDTEMVSETLPKALEFMDRHPQAGACRCAAFRDRKDIDEFILLTRFDNFLYSFLKAAHKKLPNPLSARFCMNIVLKAMMLARSNLDRNFIYAEQPRLEGAFLLVRMDALRQAGGFDARFYYAGEGYDLTERIGKFGWKMYRLISVRMVHYKSKSSEQLSGFQWARLKRDWQRRLYEIK